MGCLDLWGEGVKIFLARRGSRCGCAQGAPRFYSPDVGRGDIPGAEPEARARRVFAPGGPGVRASGLRSRGAGSCGPAGWMLPRACWRQLRQIDARARPDSVAPAAARGSMESWPRPGRAARRAIGKHGACLRGALGPGARSGGVCVRAPRVPLPAPRGWASAGHSRGNSVRPTARPQVVVVRPGGRGGWTAQLRPGPRLSFPIRRETHRDGGPRGAQGPPAFDSAAPCGARVGPERDGGPEPQTPRL